MLIALAVVGLLLAAVGAVTLMCIGIKGLLGDF